MPGSWKGRGERRMIRPGGWVNRRWLWLLSNGPWFLFQTIVNAIDANFHPNEQDQRISSQLNRRGSLRLPHVRERLAPGPLCPLCEYVRLTPSLRVVSRSQHDATAAGDRRRILLCERHEHMLRIFGQRHAGAVRRVGRLLRRNGRTELGCLRQTGLPEQQARPLHLSWLGWRVPSMRP